MKYSLQILTFHRIMPEGEDYFIPPMAMSAKTFSKLIEWMARLMKVVDLSVATDEIRADIFQGQAAAITFDDGYKDIFDIAKDILKKAGVPATFFIPVNPIDRQEPYWWDVLYHAALKDADVFFKWLKDKGNFQNQPIKPLCRNVNQYLNGLNNTDRLSFLADVSKEFGTYDGERLLMTWDEIRRLQREGFSIGSHSLSHIPLTDLTIEEAKIELEQSKILLSEKLGCEIKGFCYPRGACNEIISLMAQKAGYAYSVTTKFGSNKPGSDLYALLRRNMADYHGIRAYFPIPSYLLELTGISDAILAKRR